jgi:hypothetical protein
MRSHDDDLRRMVEEWLRKAELDAAQLLSWFAKIVSGIFSRFTPNRRLKSI